MDEDDNIYLGDLAANAIGVVGPDRSYFRLARSPELAWVDCLAFRPEGKLYAVMNGCTLGHPEWRQSAVQAALLLIEVEAVPRAAGR